MGMAIFLALSQRLRDCSCISACQLGLELLGTVYETRFANMGLVKCQIVSDNKMPFSIFPIYHALLIDLAENNLLLE
jgi:hypothetical protein